jgi:mRNA-degrading endonuclease YafQ of YafQ-DinJ toxin-antitoxin module
MHIHYGNNKIYKYLFVKNRDYTGLKDLFLKNTIQVLDYLYENDIMTLTYHKNTDKEKTLDIIDCLINDAPESIYIKEGNKNRYIPSSNTITFNHLYGAQFRKDYKKAFRGKNIGYNSPMALLAHEIIHCYHELFDENGYRKRRKDHSMKGKKRDQKWIELSFPNKEEELVIRLTNQVIKRLGEDKRRNYGRNYYLTDSVLSTKKKLTNNK